jgi:hypothetical protein
MLDKTGAVVSVLTQLSCFLAFVHKITTIRPSMTKLQPIHLDRKIERNGAQVTASMGIRAEGLLAEAPE